VPSWNIHLGVAKRISEKFDIKDNVFFLASILPDMTGDRKKTHFYTNKMYSGIKNATKVDLELFLETYKDYLNTNYILGYYTHLLCDYFYNSKVFSEKLITDTEGNVIGLKCYNGKVLNCDMEIIKDVKHNDFGKYGAYLKHKGLVKLPKFDEKIVDEILSIEPALSSKERLLEKIKYVNYEFKNVYVLSFKDKIFKLKFIIYTKEEYDEIFEKCIRFVEKEINKLGIIKK